MRTSAKTDTSGIGRSLTDADLQSVSGGKPAETKAGAVAHANDVADQMIAILHKYGLA
jgi:hypothetical protein